MKKDDRDRRKLDGGNSCECKRMQNIIKNTTNASFYFLFFCSGY
jgi:hypothetical protein